MTALGTLDEFLAGATSSADVFALRPDYRAMLVAVDGLMTGPSDETSDALLRDAEAAARSGAARASRWTNSPTSRRGERPTARSGPSPNAPATVSRRCCAERNQDYPESTGSPTSTTRSRCCTRLPLGGEDLTCYTGSPRLLRATGGEPFDTVAEGNSVTEQSRTR